MRSRNCERLRLKAMTEGPIGWKVLVRYGRSVWHRLEFGPTIQRLFQAARFAQKISPIKHLCRQLSLCLRRRVTRALDREQEVGCSPETTSRFLRRVSKLFELPQMHLRPSHMFIPRPPLSLLSGTLCMINLISSRYSLSPIKTLPLNPKPKLRTPFAWASTATDIVMYLVATISCASSSSRTGLPAIALFILVNLE